MRSPLSRLPDLAFERKVSRKGYIRVAGLDEAGRGCLAGPVVASAVIFPEGIQIPGVNDSKKLSPGKREELYREILNIAVGVGVGMAEPEEIDRLNILNATRAAMERAIAGIPVPPDYLLIDAVSLSRISLPQEAIVKGDTLSHSIASASIVAKVTRDRLMEAYHRAYPDYGFSRHKGYATREHVTRLCQFGPTPIHRKTFLKKILSHVSVP